MKKRVVFGIIIVAAVLFAMNFVIGQDEPGLSPFNASATVQSAPPSIPIIVNVSDDFGSTGINVVTPVEGSTVTTYVVFVAQDSNSESDLPTSLTIGTNVAITLEYNGSRPETNDIVAQPSDTCVEKTACDACTAPSNQRQYECAIDGMNFHFENRTDWLMNITIDDNGGLTSENNDTFSWTYLQLPAFRPIANLSWSGISLSVTNQKATNNVTLENRGNSLFTQFDLTAYNMTGASYSAATTSYIPAQSIRADGTIGNECTGSGSLLNDDVAITVDGFNLDYGSSESADMYFCIVDQLDTLGLTINDSEYFAVGNDYNADGTKDWEVT